MPTSRSFFWATRLDGKESAYGTQIPDGNMDDWLAVSEVDFADVDKQFRTDEKEINGRLGATEYELESAAGGVTRKLQASVEAVVAALIWMTGRTTSSGVADPFTQTIKIPTVCTITPPSFSLVEGLNCAGSANTFTLFKGACVEQITLEATGKSFVNLQINLKHDGSETTKASFTVPVSLAVVKKILGRHTTLKFGSLGTENISDLLRSWKVTLNAGLVVPPSVTGGIFVPVYQYGEGRPMVDFEFVIAGDRASTVYGYYKNDTQLKADLLIDPAVTPARSIEMTSAAGYLSSCKPVREGSEPRLQCKYEFLHNATDDGPATFIGKTATQNYLQT